MQTTGLQAFGFVIVTLFPAIALLAVILRIYSRRRTGSFGLDDACILLAMFLSIPETLVTWKYMQANYVGWHVWDIPADEYDFVMAMKFNYSVQVLYMPILGLVKCSILLFLLRLTGKKRNIRYTIYVVNTLTLALAFTTLVVVIFQCIPIQANWWTPQEKMERGARCIAQGPFYVAVSSITLFTDVVVLSLPMFIVYNLKMAVKTKMAVVGLFFLGFLVTVVGVARVIIIANGFLHLVPPVEDYTYNLGFTTSSIETNLAIITACTPALKPLFKSWLPGLFTTEKSNKYSAGLKTYGKAETSRFGKTNGNGSAVAKPDSAYIADSYYMKDIGKRKVEILGNHPRGESEERIITTFDGIMKTTDVTVVTHEHVVDESNGSDRQIHSYDSHTHPLHSYGTRTSVDTRDGYAT